jgi:tetratricopeptide (TPR) repeat protein
LFLFGNDPDEVIIAVYCARAAVLEGNALRLLGRLEPADEALKRAAGFLTSPFDSWDRASFFRVLGLLRWEQGHLDEAAALLRESARAFGEQFLSDEEGTSQVLAGLLCLERNQTGKAIRFLQAGRAALDPDERPWLTVRADLSLALALAEIGHTRRALRVLDEARRRYARVEGEEAQLWIHWLEGRISGRLGRAEEAEGLLMAVRLQLLAADRPGEAALCSLDLAALWVESGRAGELSLLFQDVESKIPGLDLAHLVSRALAAPLLASSEGVSAALSSVTAAVRRILRSRGIRVDHLPFG